MTSERLIDRKRGTRDARQQLALLREKWPVAFPAEPESVRPLAIGVAGEIASAMGWSLPYTLGVPRRRTWRPSGSRTARPRPEPQSPRRQCPRNPSLLKGHPRRQSNCAPESGRRLCGEGRSRLDAGVPRGSKMLDTGKKHHDTLFSTRPGPGY